VEDDLFLTIEEGRASWGAGHLNRLGPDRAQEVVGTAGRARTCRSREKIRADEKQNEGQSCCRRGGRDAGKGLR